MNNVDYTKMSDQELKQYLLNHKDDRDAFYAYLNRKHQHPKQTILSVNELETLTREEKIKLITQRLQERFSV
ncbi:DUF6887 family protein [Scytonema sp. NUACC26]|uniref:DUF6887 family protein n=1 Tax=Scytonema sp. NUACC26 TaxID=3140176 RepID=UPI0034DBEE90